jgi:hypothetical protein
VPGPPPCCSGRSSPRVRSPCAGSTAGWASTVHRPTLTSPPDPPHHAPRDPRRPISTNFATRPRRSRCGHSVVATCSINSRTRFFSSSMPSRTNTRPLHHFASRRNLSATFSVEARQTPDERLWRPRRTGFFGRIKALSGLMVAQCGRERGGGWCRSRG